MANGGMWPMHQSDRGGLLVSKIEDVPAGAAAVGAGVSADAQQSALERAKAKHRACKPGQVLEMEPDEWEAFLPWINNAERSAEPSSEARSALATAADVVDHRRAAYGSPKENFQRIADFWTIALRDKLTPGATVTLTDVAQMMRLVKEARLIETPDHFDSLVDICGYVDCQQQVLP